MGREREAGALVSEGCAQAAPGAWAPLQMYELDAEAEVGVGLVRERA